MQHDLLIEVALPAVGVGAGVAGRNGQRSAVSRHFVTAASRAETGSRDAASTATHQPSRRRRTGCARSRPPAAILRPRPRASANSQTHTCARSRAGHRRAVRRGLSLQVVEQLFRLLLEMLEIRVSGQQSRHDTPPLSPGHRDRDNDRSERAISPVASLTDDLDHQFSPPRPRVELEEGDLLPRAEEELFVLERHGQRRTQ
jgi:hypothetical protein